MLPVLPSQWQKAGIPGLAILLSVFAVFLARLVTVSVFEAVPHIEDEMAYVWQAKVFASGHLTLPTPQHPNSFIVPFVVDYEGQRFGKYLPGWPLILAIGEFFDVRGWVNPLLTGISTWLIFAVGRRLFHPGLALLSQVLFLTSPFLWVNAGSLLSHVLGLALTLGFILGWLEAFGEKERRHPRPWLPTLTAAISLGYLVITRPLTALGVCLPFILHGLRRMWYGAGEERLRLAAFIGAVVSFSSLVLAWQYVATGNPFTNPYTLWWPYDKVGFGPGYGVTEDGHSLHVAMQNTKFSLAAGWADLFGWGRWSWLFLPAGVLALLRRPQTWTTALVPFSLVLVHMAYWVGSWLFGPRYYFEGLAGAVLLSAAGIAWLAGWSIDPSQPAIHRKGVHKLRPFLLTAVLAGLVGINLTVYLPARLHSMTNLFGISASDQAIFHTAEVQALTPALVIVDADRWMEYAALLELQEPDLSSPYIFIWSHGRPVDLAVAKNYPERTILYYDPDIEPRTIQFWTIAP
jgi:hypothetical protein